IFWGFTMDARHFFCRVSLITERLRIKNWYLRTLNKTWGAGDYDNYKAYYRTNSPRDVRIHAQGFQSCELINLSRIGQLDYYIPPICRPVSRAFDRWTIRTGRPGSVLAIRLQN